MLRYCILAAMLALAAAAPVINFDATAYCYDCLSRRNHKDLYPDPNSQFNYYACQYLENGQAIATLRPCPTGLVWNAKLLICQRQANDLSGADASTPAPVSVNATVCKDSYGVYISAVAGNANQYAPLDADSNVAAVMKCPNSYSFNLATCACTDGSFDNSNLQQVQKAIFYEEYNGAKAYSDLSISHFSVDFLDGATISAVGLSDHSSNGSSLELLNNGAHTEIPGLKNYDFGNQASFCAFFLCDAVAGTRNCNQAGAVYSNNKDAQSSVFTIVAGIQSSNNFVAKLQFVGGNVVTLSSAFTINPPNSPNGFNSFCVTYNGQTASLYLNGNFATSQSYEGSLEIANCPFAIGNDQALGQFLGHVDSTLVLPFAWDAASITAFHNTGNADALL